MSTVKLYYTDRNDTYKNWELLPEKLLIVESISDYLATKTAMTIENFQYQKCEFEMGINVELAQSYAQPKTSLSFKYVSIQNTGEQVHYYFVKKAVWRSKTCVRFELVMDVLNTFQEGYDYTWKANTKITREHKDRYIRTGRECNVHIDWYAPLESGSLYEGDEVELNNDRGETVFVGIIKAIDQYGVDIFIENPVKEQVYIDLIEPYIELRFDLVNTSDPAIYYSFEPSSMQDFVFTTTFKYYRNIDYVAEGINPLLIRKQAVQNITDTGLLNQNWYLLYRNANDPDPSQYVNPVECYLIPEEQTPISHGVVLSGRITPNTINGNTYYYIRLTSGMTATLSNGSQYNSANPPYVDVLVVSKQENGLLSVSAVVRGTSPYTLYYRESFDDISFIHFTSFPVPYYSSLSPVAADNYAQNIYGNETESFDSDYEGDYIDGIDLIDRTDAKNIKLIKLPYCPYKFSLTNSRLDLIDTAWYFTSITQANGQTISVIQLNDLNTKLENEILANSPFTNLRVYLSINKEDLRDTDEVDSKLFHSSFYSPTFVYDSFALKVDLEKCDLSYYISSSLTNNIKFTMTKTINSKFMFTLTEYVCNKSDVNFYNVLPIARNNEEVLYNVPYINYIRTGYNYDIKAKNTQNASNYVGLGMSAASMGVALAVPTAPLKAAAVVGALVSMAISVKSTIVSTIQSEENIKQKLTQYQNQAASVSGSDDVDLMSEYCDNRLKYMVYEPTDNMKSLLNDLFFYAGYSSNRMAIPTHNNRLRFDYLECEASIEAAASMPQECLTELITCFKNGVVYLHKVPNSQDVWDFAQKYENWENSLLED